MKTRVVQTKYWEDPMIIDAPMEVRYLFMFYLTCNQIGLTGVFEISDKEVMLKTGLSPKQLEKAKAYLEEEKRVLFYKSWVNVINAGKYNNYANGEKNEIAAYREREMIPVEVFTVFEAKLENRNTPPGGVFYTSDSTHKSEIINKKSEYVLEGVVKGKQKKLEDLTDDDFQTIADKYQTTLAFVRSKYDDMINWHEKKPNKNYYSNYFRALSDWVKKDVVDIRKESYGKSKISYVTPPT